MTITITDAFELPKPDDIRAMGFVIKLKESDAASDETAKLVRDYVVTPAVEKALPRILDDMKQVYDRGEEYGRFIHGSFGSGKSHFMTMLAMLLEHSGPAWDKFRPLLVDHRKARQSKGQDAADHEAWLPESNLLVVRLHMLSARGRTTGLDRLVYDAFNSALKRRGKQPFEFLNVDAIFDEARREAAAYGDVVWKNLETAGIVGGKADFEKLASGSAKAKERFARTWLDFKGRDAADAGIDPRWSEGLRRLSGHAREQGFGGVVLMIDEFLLWLAEKSGQEFVKEINNLNVIVDHTTGQRPAPMFVFVARQRNLSEFFPDLVDESKIHEHIDHHAKRFEITKLQDVELRHIVQGRVLRAKKPKAVKAAIDGLAERHAKVLPALLVDADINYLRDVYPFHPALIEMLVDVTSLMQRERSALRLLYELLVVHNPTLPLGEFLPVGSAFEAIFPESGVEASKKVELMQDIHHQYYARLRPTMQRMRDESEQPLDDERHRALDQVVKTVLLAEVSPRLKQGGLTIERLVQLNSADVEGETFRSRVRILETDLSTLSNVVADLSIAGTGRSATVRYVVGRVSLGEVLNRARSKVDNTAQRFRVFWPALRQALKLDKTKGFEDGAQNQGEYEVSWRRTKRRGVLHFANVRELAYEEFLAPRGTFRVVVDYPWDEQGHSVDEDRHKAVNARKKHGTQYTVCWLPRHMSPNELATITELAAVRYLISQPGQEDLLDTLGPQDRTKVLEEASTREKTLSRKLQDHLREVYIEHGEFFPLISDIDTSRPHRELQENLDHIITLLMDRQYPQHPDFLTEPKKADVETLLQWMVTAGETNVSVAYDDSVGKVLKNLGQPLELVNLGQTKASLRFDSRYIKDVLKRADQDSLAWTPVAEHLRDTYGFQPLLVDLFLCFLCQRDHRAIEEGSGETMQVRLGMPASARVRLMRGKLVEAPAWGDLRDLSQRLFGLERPPPHRSLQTQDRFAAKLQVEGQQRREVLQGLHARLKTLGIESGPRLDELSDANAHLAPLADRRKDSFAALSELQAKWNGGAEDPLIRVVQGASRILDALAKLDQHARKHLESARGSLQGRVDAHLEQFTEHLSGRQSETPIDDEWIRDWNAGAQALVSELIVKPPPPPPPTPVAEPPPPPPAPPTDVLCEATVDLKSPDEVSAFLKSMKKAIKKAPSGRVKLALVRIEDEG